MNDQKTKQKTTNAETCDEMHPNPESIEKKTYLKYQLTKDSLMMRRTLRTIAETKLKPKDSIFQSKIKSESKSRTDTNSNSNSNFKSKTNIKSKANKSINYN